METVLIIEDSRPMQRTLQRLFEADSLGVRIASDGEEGLESFRHEPPNVVVLDLKLPACPARSFAGRSKPRSPRCPSWS
jgi:DNA-binding response OmpR family regulator